MLSFRSNGKKGVGNPDFGYLRPAGGGCVVVGDKLYFYYEATSGLTLEGEQSRNETMTINLAILRRDGFASMEAATESGTLETRPVTFNGRHLFVNLDSPPGELRVEVLDAEGKVIAPFSVENCTSTGGDKTKLEIQWKGAADVGRLQGKPVRFRFHLNQGALYSFWVSPDASGGSHVTWLPVVPDSAVRAICRGSQDRFGAKGKTAFRGQVRRKFTSSRRARRK